MGKGGKEQKFKGTKGSRWLAEGLMLGVVVLAAGEYARLSYVTLENAKIVVYGWVERPYVFRTLVPWCARILVWLGLREDVALSTVIIFSAIGLVYGIKYFISSFRGR